MERLLDNWDALKVYFKEQKDAKENKRPSEKKTSSKDVSTYLEPTYAERKVDNIYSFVRSPTNKLFVLFLNYSVKAFDEILTSIQASEPKIHVLRRSLHKLVRSILIRFVKPAAMTGKSVDQVQFKLAYNQKPDSELVIGEAARDFLKHKKDNHLKDNRIIDFFHGVRAYFMESCTYMVTKLPLNDELLAHCEVVDVDLQSSAKASSIEYFLDIFPCLLNHSRKDTLMEQFALYQTENVSSCIQKRIDETWRNIGQIKDENRCFIFKDLSTFMLNILTIPHSSAHCEHVFSTVRKNKTDQRMSMLDKTLESLLVMKSRPGESGTRFYSDKTLKRLKSSYYQSLHSS